MKPQFKDEKAWKEAELLMQPAYIRILDNLRKQEENSVWVGKYEEINHPLPGYRLCLSHKDQMIKVDIWELCFRVCCKDYSSHARLNGNSVLEIDSSLVDETGDVDWHSLETKAQWVVKQVFADLPPSKE